MTEHFDASKYFRYSDCMSQLHWDMLYNKKCSKYASSPVSVVGCIKAQNACKMLSIFNFLFFPYLRSERGAPLRFVQPQLFVVHCC